jgi:hypothetical protein
MYNVLITNGNKLVRAHANQLRNISCNVDQWNKNDRDIPLNILLDDFGLNNNHQSATEPNLAGTSDDDSEIMLSAEESIGSSRESLLGRDIIDNRNSESTPSTSQDLIPLTNVGTTATPLRKSARPSRMPERWTYSNK